LEPPLLDSFIQDDEDGYAVLLDLSTDSEVASNSGGLWNSGDVLQLSGDDTEG
jgi:hypothetical protein